MNDKDYIKISKSKLFNKEWYLSTYKDVGILGMDPIEHYLKYGLLLERDPSIEFSTSLYLETHKDVKRANINPLLHFISNGQRENRVIFKKNGTPYQLNIVDKKSVPLVRNAQTKEISVLYHSHNLKWQGAPNSLFEISKGTNKLKGFNSQLISSSEGPLTVAYQTEKIPTHIFPFPSRGIPNDESKFDDYLRRLSQKYIESGVSVIHANTLQCYFSIMAAQIANIPVLWNIRESEEPKSYFEYLPEYLRNKAFNSIGTADKVVFVANSTMELWKQYFDGANFELITNGVDVRRLHMQSYGVKKSVAKLKFGIKPNNKVLLSVGTVSQRKNQMELLTTYHTCVLSGLNKTSLLIVGINNSDYSKKIRDFSVEINAIGGDVVLVDETSSTEGLSTIADAYSSADIFVLNSFIESYPRVVVEAFSYCLPVIASKCFGTVEQINHGINGYLYDCGNTEQLGKYINLLCNDNVLRESISNAAFRRTSNLNTYPVMIEKYKQIYRELSNV